MPRGESAAPAGGFQLRKRLILVSSMLFFGVAATIPTLDYDFGALRRAPAEEMLTGGPTYTAIPAPVREQAAYRPCRRGQADDRCIQLYESRVRLARARTAAPAPVAVRVPRQVTRPVRTAALAPPPGPPIAYAGCGRLITDDCVVAFDTMRSRPSARRGSGETPGI